MSLPLDWLAVEWADWQARGLTRRITARGSAQGREIEYDGRRFLNFGSNDYLGLANHPRLIDAASKAYAAEGWGAGASPLVTGQSAAHARLENTLAAWLGTAGALVFSSGYAANVGTIAALVGPGDVVFSDAKNHASLIDGCRLSRAATRIYAHACAADLRRQLRETAGNFRRALIVTDSLFSMDGDVAPLADICDLADEFGAMLLVDEAHATGVWGSRGTGCVEGAGVADRVPIRMGTLSKAVGSAGGFVAGSRLLIDWLSNRARTYVYSTAHPPAVAAAAQAAIELIIAEPQRREQLQSLAVKVRHALFDQGWRVGQTCTQIIPVAIGDAASAMECSARLRDAGLWVPGIRPPSVPPGEALLRISLTAAHTAEDIDRLCAGMAELRNIQPSV